MITGFPNLAAKVDSAFIFIVAISLVLLALVTFLMIFFVVRYSRKRNPDPQNIEGNLLLEIVWTLIPTILVLAMFFYSYAGFKLMRHPPKGSMLVKVMGRKWSWLFTYENGKQSDKLFVPLGKPVKLSISSEDVLHSLFIPAFRVKEDAVPGMETFLWFAGDEVGDFDLFCAEYCGMGHSAMITKVVVMEPDKFGKWYASKEGAKAEGEKEEGLSHEAEEGRKFVVSAGCLGCHSTDGTKKIGPSFKGIYLRKSKVLTDGKEREITSDAAYLKRSITHPEADIVKGYPPIMPPQTTLTDKEVGEIIEFLKTIR